MAYNQDDRKRYYLGCKNLQSKLKEAFAAFAKDIPGNPTTDKILKNLQRCMEDCEKQVKKLEAHFWIPPGSDINVS